MPQAHTDALLFVGRSSGRQMPQAHADAMVLAAYKGVFNALNALIGLKARPTLDVYVLGNALLFVGRSSGRQMLQAHADAMVLAAYRGVFNALVGLKARPTLDVYRELV